MCVLCHNPSLTDVARRPTAINPQDRELPPQGVNFNLLIHRIHTGEHLAADGKSYTVVGFGGSHNDFTEVRYAAMSPTGTPGDLRNCAMCHVNGSEQILTRLQNDVMDPQGPINPVKPITSACTGCHVSPVHGIPRSGQYEHPGRELRYLPRTKLSVLRREDACAVIASTELSEGAGQLSSYAPSTLWFTVSNRSLNR